jgi:hypothetical protein
MKSEIEDERLEKKEIVYSQEKHNKRKHNGRKILPNHATRHDNRIIHLQGAPLHPGAPHLEPDVGSRLPEPP